MKTAILLLRTEAETNETLAATRACNYLKGLDKKHVISFQDRDPSKDLVQQIKDFWLRHQDLDKIVILWDRAGEFPYVFQRDLEPSINLQLRSAGQYEPQVSVVFEEFEKGETNPPRLGVRFLGTSYLYIDVIKVDRDVAADYVLQLGVRLGVFKALPNTKNRLINQLRQAANLLDGGNEWGAYAYGIFTFGMPNRLSGATEKARKLRALANAISRDQTFEELHEDDAEDENFDYHGELVKYYMEKTYGKDELQRKRSILPFMKANETLSVNSLAEDRRHPWLDWMLGRSAYATTTGRMLGVKPAENQVIGLKT